MQTHVSDSFDLNTSAGPRLAQVEPPRSLARLALFAVFALLITSAALWTYIHFEHKPPTATGEIARVAIYPVQAKIQGGGAGASGMAGQDEIYNQILVLAHVKLRNDNATPLTMDDDWAVVTMPDGETRRSLGASVPDFDKVFLAYPQLTPLRMDPLRRNTPIPPHQSVDGLLIFSYPLSREQWDSRKSMAVTVSFSNAQELVLAAPAN